MWLWLYINKLDYIIYNSKDITFPIYVLLVCKYSMQRRDKYEKMIVVFSKNHTSKVSFLE